MKKDFDGGWFIITFLLILMLTFLTLSLSSCAVYKRDPNVRFERHDKPAKLKALRNMGCPGSRSFIGY